MPGFWIPACAGMPVRGEMMPGFWIPACAGMTVGGGRMPESEGGA